MARIIAAFTLLMTWQLQAQTFVPTDVGTSVNGFQDDFDGTTLNTNWIILGSDVFSVSQGLLHVGSGPGDPNHLLLALPGYDGSVQKGLAGIRIASFGSGDPVRGGIGVGVDPNFGQGINYLFRNNNSEGQTGIHTALLDDFISWGPGQNFVWQTSKWYWMRLRQDPDVTANGGAADVFAKIWLADGSVPEPANWQLAWDYTSSNPLRTGLAGITASSSSGLFNFDVDYVLIKAAGLPSIVVAPTALLQVPVAITNQPQNQTIIELSPVTFTVGTTGFPAPTFQWYRGSAAITGATDASYKISSVSLADTGAQFKTVAQNLVSNITCVVTSTPATLTVLADTNPPVLSAIQTLGLDQVQVSFSEAITLTSATNVSHYSINGPLGLVNISSVLLDSSQSNVVLSVAPLTEGALYTLAVHDLTDRSAAANLINPNSRTQFVANSYSLAGVGNSTPPGLQVPAGGGYDISGGGAAIGGTNDQFQFSYHLSTGDFDLKTRLESLSLVDPWSEAGLMVRADLSAGSPFAAIAASPSISGTFFQTRALTNGTTSRSGSFPVNYPNIWLRLTRVGNQFTGYAGIDGQNWIQLGVVNLALPANVYFGFAISSRATNQLATAAFREISPVTQVGTNAPPMFESLGQCNPNTSLALSEIMYHPTNSNLEFIELFNSRGEPQDVSDYQLDGSISFTFPAGTSIPGGGFLVVANSPTDLMRAYGLTGVLGPYTNNLPNNSGIVRLLSQAGAVLLATTYDSTPPWPISPDGAGHSLVLARPSYGEDNPLAWAASDAVGGSPGRLDTVTVDPLRAVVINEFLAHIFPSSDSFIELFNRSTQPLDLSGCVLTDDPKLNKCSLPPGTTILPRGFLSYKPAQLGFALRAGGGTIFLRRGDGLRVLDAVRYEAQTYGVSTGRAPDGSPGFRPLAYVSPGAANSQVRKPDIVINEIMYAPVSLDDDDQYVELYNRTTDWVDLSGWKFVSGINFIFPAGLRIAPNGYFVVARNVSRMLAHYPNLNASNLTGNFGGSLAHKGERLALARPELDATNPSATNIIYPVMNEVTYQSGGRWGQWSHAGGSSLELINPNADNSLASNWADSDETHKAPWTLISATGKLDNGDVPPDELQVLIQGVGECLIDHVQVTGPDGANRIANPGFEGGANGWAAQGTEKTSSLEPAEGYNSSQSYHLRAVEKADNQVNRVLAPLTSALTPNTANVTIAAAVRWLKGDPEILFRLRGNWLECAAELDTSNNLGTPGARNSRFQSNAPPALWEVQHSPILPAANQPITVSARVNDPDGLTSVLLKYRLDPATSYYSVPMTDQGTGGDALARDGIFTATIPGQASGSLVALYLQATDGLGASASFPNDAPARECLVRVGESQPSGNFPVYRLWVTSAAFNRWNGNSRLDNSFNDATFVLGNQRVIYNAGVRFKGSPYISPGFCGPACRSCGYSISFPADDLFRGSQDLVIDWPGGHGGETSALQEQMCYWIADRLNLPWSHRHTIRLHVNGITDEARQTTFEEVVQPAGDFIKEWSPSDTGGQFFKIERAFEFSDNGGLVDAPEPRLQVFTTTGGVKKREKYRWNFMFRASDRRDDYSDIFALVDAVNATAPEPYTSATESLVNIEEWMGIFATEHIIVNFDAYGHDIGKNMYAYLPVRGKWQLYLFDLDWAMLAAAGANSIYAPGSATLFNSEDPTIARMYGFPPFARAYWRAVQAAIDGPLNPANCNPVIDAKSSSLFANGIRWCDSQPLTDARSVKTWFSQRRAGLQKQIARVTAPFAVNSADFSNNVAIVKGTAPITVGTLSFNGAQWPLVWTSVTNWTATVVLQPGTNELAVLGLDTKGRPLAGLSANISLVYSGLDVSPVGHVVLSEIMYHPLTPDAQFVELFNTSTNLSFDLSGCLFQVLSYTFPAGSLIGPSGFLVLAANRAAFATAYGATNRIFDTFPGILQTNGETLALLQPGTNGSPDSVITRVRYSNSAPWPSGADGSGSSLQLIDPHQDNWRVGNWATISGSSLASPISTPGTNNSVAAALSPFPTLWINELQADNQTDVTNHAGFHVPWIELFNPSTNPIPLAGLYLSTNYASLLDWAFPADAMLNPGEFKIIFADGRTDLSTATEWHTSFTLTPGSGSLALSRLSAIVPQVLDYVDYTNLSLGHSYGSVPDGQSFTRQEFPRGTPGRSNGFLATASFIAYTSAGSVYTQTFNSLPNPGPDAINAANPVTINGYVYTLDNPYDFAAASVASGGTGGLGIPELAGWDGSGLQGTKFGASPGDQTTGGQISFGSPNSNDRSLGLLATSSTGGTAFGAKFINQTTQPLNTITVQFTGELWRQSNIPKLLKCSYWIDPTAVQPFSTSSSGLLPALDVSFPANPNAVGGSPVDGHLPANQSHPRINNQPIIDWPPWAALWLVWEMADSTGKGQGLAIDEFSFSADYLAAILPVQVFIQSTGTHLVLSWPTTPGQQFQVEYIDDLATDAWMPLGAAITGNGTPLTFTYFPTNAQRFFRIRSLP